MPNRIYKVVVVADFSIAAGRNFFSGVLSFARTRPDWNVRVIQSASEFSAQTLAKLERDGTDGIITTEMGDARVQALMDASRIPLVIVGSHRTKLPTRQEALSYLTVDEVAIGRAAAEHLLGLGAFRSYAYVHYTEEIYLHVSTTRKRGFKTRLAKAGISIRTFDDTTGNRQRLIKWIKSLPKPAAILAGSDARAADVLRACAKARLAVPGQVMVLGIDNDELICCSCKPKLSSLMPGADTEGVAAAEELHHIMNHPFRSKTPHMVVCPPSPEFFDRESTAIVKPAAHLIRKALDYIEANANHPVRVEDVVRHVRVSRRLAELRFREIQNEGIAETIARIRYDNLARALREKEGSIADICRRCGFTNIAYVAAAFKRRYGMTMKMFRR